MRIHKYIQVHIRNRIHPLPHHLSFSLNRVPCCHEYLLSTYEYKYIIRHVTCVCCSTVFFLDLIETELPSASSALPSPIPRNSSRSVGHQLDVSPAIIGGSVGVIFLFVAMVILIILLSTCIVMVRRRRMTSESLPQHNVKGVNNDVLLCVQVRES